MELTVGAFTYRVVIVEAVSDPEEPGAYGYCSPSRRVIELRFDQSVDHAFETLAHEYGHACEKAGIDLDQEDEEKRMTAAASMACAFYREYQRAGGDDALVRLLGINRKSEEIERQTPDVKWAELEGRELYSAVLRHVYCRTLNDVEFATYRSEIEAKRLNPFVGECYPLRDKDTGNVMIGIKLPAIRRLAREAGARLGNYEWAGEDGVWRDLYVATEEKPYPYAARCPVITTDGEIIYAVAHWHAYAEFVVMDKVRTPTPWWRRMGAHLLALCAERQAAGRVIPAMSNVVIPEEMQYRGRRVESKVVEPAKPREMEDQRVPDEEIVITDDDSLRAAMAKLGCGVAIIQTAFIRRAEKDNLGLREDNFEGFAARVLAAVKASR